MDAIQVALAQNAAEQQRHHPKSTFFWVWGALLIFTGVEVYLAYQNMELVRMLTLLMGLSIIKAWLIIAYFMHLKYEVSRMKWLTMTSLVVCLVLMCIFLPDAHRVVTLGVR
jgi:cytochrome c oxidase subunit IV